mmetsp:Transcript_17212/g.49876  ORF Transcript_17212/g.49876 Transcript_17212/m.49876 type:complete len:447 (-) Transcript_17212:589-1929(-)
MPVRQGGDERHGDGRRDAQPEAGVEEGGGAPPEPPLVDQNAGISPGHEARRPIEIVRDPLAHGLPRIEAVRVLPPGDPILQHGVDGEIAHPEGFDDVVRGGPFGGRAAVRDFAQAGRDDLLEGVGLVAAFALLESAPDPDVVVAPLDAADAILLTDFGRLGEGYRLEGPARALPHLQSRIGPPPPHHDGTPRLVRGDPYIEHVAVRISAVRAQRPSRFQVYLVPVQLLRGVGRPRARAVDEVSRAGVGVCGAVRLWRASEVSRAYVRDAILPPEARLHVIVGGGPPGHPVVVGAPVRAHEGAIIAPIGGRTKHIGQLLPMLVSPQPVETHERRIVRRDEGGDVPSHLPHHAVPLGRFGVSLGLRLDPLFLLSVPYLRQEVRAGLSPGEGGRAVAAGGIVGSLQRLEGVGLGGVGEGVVGIVKAQYLIGGAGLHGHGNSDQLRQYDL